MTGPLSSKQVEKLLGGYAAGILTDAEQKALFDAALRDQALFEALADEEVLREVFADHAARAQLLAALQPSHPSWGKQLADWFRRPFPIAAASTVAVAMLAVGIFRQAQDKQVPTDEPQSLAAPSASQAPVPKQELAPAPIPEKAPKLSARSVKAKQQIQPKGIEEPVQSADAAAGTRENRLAAVAEPPPPPQPQPRSDPPAVALQSAPVSPMPLPPPPAPVTAPPKATVVPLRYTIQRRQQDGSWVEFGGELSAGDAVRISVEAMQAGFLRVTGPGEQLLYASNVAPGQQIVVPASGELPSQSGARSLEIALYRSPPEPEVNFAFRARKEAAAEMTRRAAEAPATAKGPATVKGKDTRSAAPLHAIAIRLVYR